MHLGIDSGLGNGDGNWVDYFEGLNFTASLVSASSGVVTNSIQFGITDIGIRPSGATFLWTSSAATNSFGASSEELYTLDTTTGELAGYSGKLRTGNGGQYQVSDFESYEGQSIVFEATFIEGTGAPSVTMNPSNEFICAGNNIAFSAAAVGYPTPTVQWQVETNGGSSFVAISGATNTTLTLTPSLSDSGNQYQAVFTNSIGSATTAAAILTVDALPSALISVGATSVSSGSTNMASAPAGATSYSWTLSNGTITSATNLQTITYIAGTSGSISFNLTVDNASGCAASYSTNISIVVAAPLFSSLALTNGEFQFTLTGTVGACYIVQATTNLTSPTWVSLSTNIAPFVFTDANSPSFGERFYRAISAP